MITREEYLKALDIVEAYHKQLNISNFRQLRVQLNHDLNRNDFVEYLGGSESRYLTEGTKYRLTCKPYSNRVCIINDSGKRMNTNSRYFKGAYLWISLVLCDGFRR